MVSALAQDDRRTADEHDDESCTCTACTRERARDRARAGTALGGISAFGHAVLGAGWLEEDEGGNVMDQVSGVESLAQRAMGSCFEQLERIGSIGREKCLGPRFTSTPPQPGITRREAVELIRFANDALDYGRLHLDYLEARDAAPDGVRLAEPDTDEVRDA